ncbi:Kunitz/Bovine pancreatic trypsin inhibitor domain protein [Oesophagostomum dentatum]|uniref:Kunitz/Bovine pancreatic trypsin inhibitor domain protein n=1 Tax=Oesophagostomum dentatum TaxID=61180 RepID=A0A0B1ST05_OESDE|nr:Kunitz/Bovine pancreatic trypsin inhibitor domain protein [Oesophagostomum dentatum]
MPEIHRYAYDSKTRTCVQFVYGGCKGNTNNFETWDDCASTCGLSSTPQPEGRFYHVCQLDIDPGPCIASLTRYAYNKTSKQCVEFTYGGCKGNDNHFLTMQECISRCAPQQPEDIMDTTRPWVDVYHSFTL